MPGEYIDNPRRSPRAPVRCEARVALRDGGFFAAPTNDYGPRGCQLPTPVPLTPGSRVFVELAHSSTPLPFRFSGRVAWARADPAPRAGVAFDEGSAAPAAELYDRLTAADPALEGLERAPDRITVDATLAPAPPPGAAPSLLPEEALVLAAIGEGLTAGALRARLEAQWGEAVNALFALLGRRYLVVGPPDAAAAASWAPHLARAAAGR